MSEATIKAPPEGMPGFLWNYGTGEPLRLPPALNAAVTCPECGARLVLGGLKGGLYHCSRYFHGRLIGAEQVLERAGPHLGLLPGVLATRYERLRERFPPVGMVDRPAGWLAKQLVRCARDEPQRPLPEKPRRARRPRKAKAQGEGSLLDTPLAELNDLPTKLNERLEEAGCRTVGEVLGPPAARQRLHNCGLSDLDLHQAVESAHRFLASHGQEPPPCGSRGPGGTACTHPAGHAGEHHWE